METKKKALRIVPAAEATKNSAKPAGMQKHRIVVTKKATTVAEKKTATKKSASKKKRSKKASGKKETAKKRKEITNVQDAFDEMAMSAGILSSALESSRTNALITTGSASPEKASRISVTGIPSFSLATEYLWGMNIIPFKRVIHIFGAPGSNKSTFYYAMQGHFVRYGGLSYFVETESKENLEILENFATVLDQLRVKHTFTNDIKEAYSFITKHMTKIGEVYGRLKSPDLMLPVVWGIDSVASLLPPDVIDKIMTEGKLGNRFANENRLHYDASKALLKNINKWPMMLCFINHMTKVKEEGSFVETTKTKGGKGFNYFASSEIEMIEGKLERRAHGNFKTITMKSQKTSVVDKRFIKVRIMFRDIPNYERGGVDRETRFLWHEAAVEQLIVRKDTGPALAREIIGDLCNIQKKAGAYWCTKIGVPESDKMSAEQLGVLIHQNEDLMKSLRTAMSVKVHPIHPASQKYNSWLEAKEKELGISPTVLGGVYDEEGPETSAKKSKKSKKSKAKPVDNEDDNEDQDDS